MEIPNARILEDGVIRVGAAQALPFRWFTGGMGVFPGLEFSGRLTEMTNIPALSAEYGNYKDKAFDIKYQVLPESKWFPALAVGLHDFHGTKLFEAQYVTLSRQVFPFDFTIGLGTKRLKGLKIPFTDKVGLFGGVELSLNPRINLMAEYNPIDYEKGRGAAGRAIPEGARYPVDIGMRAKILPGINMGLSYQRGDTLGIMLHVQTELGKPILPQRANPPPQVEVDKRPFEKRDLRKMVKEIYRAIHDEGFSDVSVYTDGENLIAEFSNTRYLSYQKAAGRVLRILLLHAPSDAKKLTAIVKQKALPILKVSVAPDHFRKYLLGEIPEQIFQKLVQVKITRREPDPTKLKAFFSGDRGFSYRPGIKPEFQTYLNDPSGFFKFRVGMKPYAVADLWKGAQGYARYDIPFYSNIRSSNVPVPGAVASDSWKYMGRSYSFDRLMIDQTLRLSKRVFGRLSFGYFESMFAGAGGEVLGFFGDGNIALGLESDLVRKREPKTQFNLTDLRAHTLLASGYYRSPGLGTTLEVQYGRFLAGDVGWLLTLSREYDTGVIIGAWYSKTSTENLTEYNRGYNDKGVFLSLPARIFLTHDSTERYYYALRPWTRDVAAKVYHWQSLFDMASDLMPAVFRSRISDLKR